MQGPLCDVCRALVQVTQARDRCVFGMESEYQSTQPLVRWFLVELRVPRQVDCNLWQSWVPYFSKDGKDFRRTYNALGNGHEKPTYRGPWSRRQVALIPIRAFFEPSYESGRPVRWRIERQDGEPFTVAALWDTWKPKDSPDSRLHSFSMLTMNADGHPLMGRFHAPGSEKRSLVVVQADRREAWLQTEDLGAFLREIPADEFTSQADPLPPRKKAAEPVVLEQQRTEPVLSEQQRLDLLGWLRSDNANPFDASLSAGAPDSLTSLDP